MTDATRRRAPDVARSVLTLQQWCAGGFELGVGSGVRGQTVYVDHVPAWVCTRCGEQYFDAPVYKRLEAIAKHAHRIKRKVTFPLADYDAVRA